MPSLAVDADHAQTAFEAFAPYYDPFTAHHDYEGWMESLLGLAAENGMRGSRALDVGCGTGKSTLPLVERGFHVTACDHSPAMLAQARAKAGDRVRFRTEDVRRLPILGQFDLITALCDIVNYLIEPAELVAMFEGIAANLAPNGLVVFDANTLWIYDNFWAEHDSAQAGEATISWECLVGPCLQPGGLATARVHVLSETGHHTSLHYQRHHPRAVVEEALRSAGLEAIAVHGQFPDGRHEPALDERRHNKAIYLARVRPSSVERR